jgi:hypothetical protein
VTLPSRPIACNDIPQACPVRSGLGFDELLGFRRRQQEAVGGGRCYPTALTALTDLGDFEEVDDAAKSPLI